MTDGRVAAGAIVSPNIRVRYPEHFFAGEGAIVDDFCYFSTRVTIGRYTHVANNCSVAGGVARTFTLGDWSSLSAGVRVWCASDDFRRSLVALMPPGTEDLKEGLIEGDVHLGPYTGVGANAVIMPGAILPEGTTVGALSFVPANTQLEPWSVYAGVPVRRLGPRDRDAVLRQVRSAEERLRAGRA